MEMVQRGYALNNTIWVEAAQWWFELNANANMLIVFVMLRILIELRLMGLL